MSIPESTGVDNDIKLEALRQSHGHLPPEEFFALAMSLNIALPPDPEKDPPDVPKLPIQMEIV